MLTDQSPEAVRARLQMFADLHAARLGYRFGRGSRELVGGLVDRAAGAIGITGLEGHRREVEIRQAEAALGVFVEAMVAAAQARSATEGEDTAAVDAGEAAIIGETTFMAAQLRLCPCWPIC